MKESLHQYIHKSVLRLVKNVLLKFDLKILLYPKEFYYILLYPNI